MLNSEMLQIWTEKVFHRIRPLQYMLIPKEVYGLILSFVSSGDCLIQDHIICL